MAFMLVATVDKTNLTIVACKCCGLTLGYTDSKMLLVEPVVHRRTVTFSCTRCGTEFCWYALKPTNVNPKAQE
jgi:hypothetical protein